MGNARSWSSPAKWRKLILFGTGDLARIAHEYFEGDSEYRVVAFTVDRAYIKKKELCGLPVIPFDEVNEKYPPEDHDIHICIVYDDLNRTRAAKCGHAKHKGYKLASYVSSYAFVSPSAILGEHHFIFEDNTIQPFVTIGDNCILWSGNHVGHDTKIENDVFISSHVVISGWCNVGHNCFLGVNSTLSNNTILGAESWVMPCAYLKDTIPPNSLVKSKASEFIPLNEKALKWALEKAKR